MTILEPEVSSFRNADATVTQHTDCTLQTYEGTRNRVNVTAVIIATGVMVNIHIFHTVKATITREERFAAHQQTAE